MSKTDDLQADTKKLIHKNKIKKYNKKNNKNETKSTSYLQTIFFQYAII